MRVVLFPGGRLQLLWLLNRCHPGDQRPPVVQLPAEIPNAGDLYLSTMVAVIELEPVW